jgi:hypothetical protein
LSAKGSNKSLTYRDIEPFRVMRLWPRPDGAWRVVTPADWAIALLAIRTHGADVIDRALAAAEVPRGYVRGTQ